jgi:hypothetical protein
LSALRDHTLARVGELAVHPPDQIIAAVWEDGAIFLWDIGGVDHGMDVDVVDDGEGRLDLFLGEKAVGVGRGAVQRWCSAVSVSQEMVLEC